MTNFFSDKKLISELNQTIGFKSDCLGAKAANLAALQRIGLKVPPSIVIKPAQIHTWLSKLPEYETAIEDWRYWKEDRYPASLAILQQRLLKLDPPKVWNRIVGRIYDLKAESSTKIIFRSNMNVEDANHVSFAGCYRSVVAPSTTHEDLWQCFLQVISSAFEEPSAMRVLEAGISPIDFSPGVLIQPIIEAKSSGILFTRHPNSLFDSPEDIISAENSVNSDSNASPAISTESDGIEKPDSFTGSQTNQKFGLIEWAKGGCQEIVEGTTDTNTEEFSCNPELDNPPSELKPFWDQLKDMAFDTDAHFKGPTDIEWIWDGFKLWIIQARPISTAEAQIARITEKGHHWTREESRERFPDALNTVSWSSIIGGLEHNIETLSEQLGIKHRSPKNVAICHNGYVYTDPKFFNFPKGIKVRWSHFLAPWKNSSWGVLSALINYVVRTSKGQDRSLKVALLKIDLADATLGPIAKNLKIRWRNHKTDELEKLKNFNTELAKQRQSGDFRRKIIYNIEGIQVLSKSFLKTDLLIYIVKETLFKTLFSVWKALDLKENDFTSIFRANEDNVSIQVNEDLVRLAKVLLKDPNGEKFIEKLSLTTNFDEAINSAKILRETNSLLCHKFLFSHSHVCPSWDISKPSWGECPSQLAPVIQGFMHQKDNLKTSTTSNRNPTRQKFRNELSKLEVKSTLDKIFRLADQVEDLIVMDEEQHYLTGKYVQPSKLLLKDAGDYLVDREMIQTASDCFHLTVEEILSSLKGQGINWNLLISRRKSELNRKNGQVPHEIPSRKTAKATELSSSSSSSTQRAPGTFGGLPVSNGTAQGKLLLANNFEQAKALEPGSILLTKTPNPSLVPLYPLIGGIITASGGQLSHGFIAAREYSIPAVSNSQYEELKKIVGQNVHIDGGTGEITVIGPARVI